LYQIRRFLQKCPGGDREMEEFLISRPFLVVSLSGTIVYTDRRPEIPCS